MKNTDDIIRISETKFIMNRTRKLADEQLAFLKGKRLGNGARYHTRRNVSIQFKNLFGLVPEGFHHCA